MKIFEKIANTFNNIFWKIYFVMLVFLYINIYVSAGIPTDWNLVNFVFLILILIGFFGTIWRKRILNQLFWKIIFVISIGWKIGSLVIDFPHSIVVYIGIFAFFFPLYIALYGYAFKDIVWRKDEKEKASF